MGRLWVSDFIHLRSLAWNLRLACRARRYGDRCDCSVGVGCSPASAWFCGGQELRGLEPLRHFGPYRGCEYRGAGPAARSQSLWSCFNGSYDTAAAGAGSDILGADILDTAFDCAISGATSRQRDFVTVARRVVEHAIGEHLDGTPLEDPDAGKNPAALALSKLGASKGRKGETQKALARKGKESRESPSHGWAVSSTTIFAGYTPRSASLPRWKQESQIMSGQSKNCAVCYPRRHPPPSGLTKGLS